MAPLVQFVSNATGHHHHFNAALRILGAFGTD